MNDSDKIVKALGEIKQQLTGIDNRVGTVEKQLGTIQKDVSGLKQDVSILKQDMTDQKQDMSTMQQIQARTITALESLAEGQKDIRAHMATREETATKTETATKADIMDLRSDLTKKLKSHDRRINTIEDELDLPHPHKN